MGEKRHISSRFFNYFLIFQLFKKIKIDYNYNICAAHTFFNTTSQFFHGDYDIYLIFTRYDKENIFSVNGHYCSQIIT